METTERIVEAYVRYIKGWATIPNIRCGGQLEIDLLAIEPADVRKRYHIETGVSISGAYSKLTARSFSEDELKERVKAAGQRRTLGYFAKRKFSRPEVISKLQEYGFKPGNYTKIIVTWGWEDGVEEQARAQGIELWDFRDLLQEIADQAGRDRSYFTDDTLRTLSLFAHATKASNRTDKAGR